MATDDSQDDQTQSFITLTKGTRVSHYKIIEKIGSGGMGEVYLAEDTQLDRKVALKFLPAHLCQDENCRKRFEREAKAAARLDHPNIVPVYEVGEFQERPFIAMAYIEGKSLREVIREGKLSINEAIEFTRQICEGLHKAHDSGIVHRDIKPGNIVIDADDKARILDFGLAAVAGEDKLTKTGSTLGTVGYMSPEQVEGKKCDHRSDLFSVGVILYEMLTGRRPFEGDNDAAIVKAITDSTPEPVARFKSGATGELQQIVDKALAKDLTLRYQHADGMLADLKRLQIGPPSQSKRSTLIYWMAAVVIIIVAGYFGYGHFLPKKPRHVEPKRLVVLPFDNSGPDDQSYFASGITDEIITKLTAINDLQVVAGQAAARMKKAGADLKEIGEKLDVEYILDASVQWQESSTGSKRVKLVAQLINPSNGSIIWAKAYDTVMTEVFSVQSNMAEQVAEQMGIVLTPEEKSDVWARYTDSEEAWDYFLRARKYEYRRIVNQKKNAYLAIDMLSKAIEIDSTFGRAYADMSIIYSYLYNKYLDRSDSIKTKAKETAEKAVELTPLHPTRHLYAHRALSDYYMRVEEDMEKGLEELKLAYKNLDRENNPYYLANAWVPLQAMGRWEEAYEHAKKAAKLLPRNDGIRDDFGWLCQCLRKYEEAEGQFLTAIKLRPEYIGDYGSLAGIYLDWQGDIKKARDVIRRSWSKVDTANWSDMLIKLDIYDGNLDLAMERSIENRDYGNIAWIYELAGKEDSALLFWDTLLIKFIPRYENNSNNALFHAYMGWIHAHKGNLDSAYIYARRATNMWTLKTHPSRGVAPLKTLIDIHIIAGKYDSALQVIEKLLSVPAEFDLGTFFLDPDYRQLIHEPGFADLVRKYGNEYHKELYQEKVGPL